MQETVTESLFINRLIACDNTFSYQGAKALFDHLEQTDTKEFDPVGLRGTYQEYEDIEEVQEDYSFLDVSSEDFEQVLNDQTTVIRIPNTSRLIIQNF